MSVTEMSEYEQGQLADAIEGQVPYDGPHSRDKVTDAAHGLYALVRYMNNATQPGRAEHTLPYASSVGSVLGGLSAALYAMSQLLDQLDSAVVIQAPMLYDDRNSHDDPALPVNGQTTAAELREAMAVLQQQLQQAAAAADSCHALSSHLGHRT